jgi:predicted MFS family arabinose efflux permease
MDRRFVVSALGIVQILAWGTSFYFPAVFAAAIVSDTGWSFGYVVSGTSIGLLVGGLISPQVGALIDRHGGRPVLMASSLFYAMGLAGAGLAPNLPIYLASWVIIGVGMGTGLYDAVFATLGRVYGSDARGPITNLTLFGGFASTVCWPLSAFMIDHFGWRIACLVFAALHLCLALPLQMAVVRRAPASVSSTDVPPTQEPSGGSIPVDKEGPIFALVALVLSLTAGIGVIVIVNFMIFLQATGIDYAAAVGLGTLFGPAQVGARLIESLFGTRYHPIWTMVASCVLMAAGLLMLFGHFPNPIIVILAYAAGYGIFWVGRGTLPLALFGPLRFPRLMGKIAFPSLIVQALAPSAGAWLIETSGPHATIGVLTVLALINVVLIGLLWALCYAGKETIQ